MKVETFKIKSWKEEETGLVVAENDDWILVKYIPTDYAVDGYKLYRKKFVKKRVSNEIEAQIARVLKLKKVNTDLPDGFEFTNVIDTLKWVETRYGLFEFQEKKEIELFYGKINQHQKNIFVIDMIMEDGKIERDFDYDFSTKSIRAISFESDYFESIRLLMNDELLNQ